ncbi:ATP-binding cassette domain-containing protein, partial [Gordonia alkanivorans]
MIKLENVTMQYKASSRPALKDLSFEVDKGEFAFLIGPSGSGKSTFFRLLLKEDRPTSGDVYLGEFHVNKMPARSVPKLRQSIGCVFQDFRLLQKKTVAENVAFALEVIGRP